MVDAFRRISVLTDLVMSSISKSPAIPRLKKASPNPQVSYQLLSSTASLPVLFKISPSSDNSNPSGTGRRTGKAGKKARFF